MPDQYHTSSDMDFEHVVLEAALEQVLRRFRRHLQIIQPAINMLLLEVEKV